MAPGFFDKLKSVVGLGKKAPKIKPLDNHEALLQAVGQFREAASALVQCRRELNVARKEKDKQRTANANAAMDKAAEAWNQSAAALDEESKKADPAYQTAVSDFKDNITMQLVAAHKLPPKDPAFHSQLAQLAGELVAKLDILNAQATKK